MPPGATVTLPAPRSSAAAAVSLTTRLVRLLAVDAADARRTLPSVTASPAPARLGTLTLPGPALVIVLPSVVMPPVKETDADPLDTVNVVASASTTGAAITWLPLATVSVA